MKQRKFPRAWDEERVRRVLAHYEQQTEAEAVAEDEASFEDTTQAVMEVPRELVSRSSGAHRKTPGAPRPRVARDCAAGLHRWSRECLPIECSALVNLSVRRIAQVEMIRLE
ncbi:MAG: hypothetical protein ABR568_21255 [Pyrinomonadaceae bacterium]